MPNGKPDFSKDLKADALGLLLEQYKGKPVLEALIASYVAECSELRDVIQEVVLARDARTAYGIWLDVVGKIVGAARNSGNDEAYRLLINTKIAQNRSSGRASDFERIWELLGNDPANLRLTEFYPAEGQLTSTQPVTNPFLTSAEMLDVLKRIFFQGKVNAAGVRLTFVFATDTNGLQFTSSISMTSDPAHALSDSTHPATQTYGKLASVIL